MNDPERAVLEPDPASHSGISVRIIGWSQTANAVLTVIVLNHEGREYGVNAWRSNSTDLHRYREE